MVEMFLELDGFSVCTASHGLEAFDCLEHERPCLILLDVSMPVMDGIAFGRALRRHADSELAHTPIVLLSALQDLTEALEATGAIDVVSKPVDFDRVMSIVERYCSGDEVVDAP